MIVSDIAGTTRDAVDTEVVRNGTEYVFIDTAGLRRKSKIKEELERYSIIRTVSAVETCGCGSCWSSTRTEGVTEQDAKIAGIAHEQGQRAYHRCRQQVGCDREDRQDHLRVHQ